MTLNGQLLLTALYIRKFFTFGFEKRSKVSRYKRIVFQNFNIGHLNKTFTYKTLKLLRLYSDTKGQERVKDLCEKNSVSLVIAAI